MASDEPADDFEVFVNFRGRDTRLGLVNVLRSRLKAAAIRFFYDDKSIPKGEEIDAKILGSIDRSHVYVVMLSENYAESKWCLLELARMVSQKESNGAKVILPCFCGVTVENVKLKEGSSYKEQLQNLVESKLQQIKASDKEERDKKKEEQEALDQKKEWEAALKKVTRFKGLHLNTGYEDFCKEITEAVQLTLKERYLSIVPVGTSEDAETLEKMLDIGSGDVKFLVIHGKRGTGKTTLARTVFQRLSTRFQGSSFISYVQEKSMHPDFIYELKRKMLRDICGDPDESGDIKKDFRDKKVLIVLDDVELGHQKEELAGSSTWFGPGSRIIITTENRADFSSHKRSSENNTSSPPTEVLGFKVKPKSRDDGLKLFSRYAFGQDSPSGTFSDLSSDIVKHCQGLPLLLQIMGSHLRRERNENRWEAMRDELKACGESVDKKLENIYNQLDKDEQNIFLDVACFFVNEEKTNPAYMWKRAEALEKLLMWSLVKMVDGNKLWMPHDLRVLGRNIVIRAGMKSLLERCRFWEHHEAQKVLEAEGGTCNVKGLCFTSTKRLCFGSISVKDLKLTPAKFVNKKELMFLKLDYVRFSGDFKNKLADLRWLSWHYCPHDFEGKNFVLSDLVILDLAKGYIKDDWRLWEQIADKNLKVIDLTSCGEITKTPGFSNFENLERLVLEDCAKLAEIDSSIGDLKHLKCLNVKGCDSLKGLPDEICSVKTLTEILISKKQKGPCNFSLPDMIGSLESLTVLEIVNVEIGGLPTSVGDLKKLQRLSLLGCSGIQKLPESIGELQSLAELQISGTTISTLPDSIGDLQELRVIKMEHSSIRSLPGAITKLRKLEELHARDSEDLQGDVPGGIEKLSQLKILDLSYTSIGELPETFGQLPNLHNLQLQSCHALRNLRKLPQTLTDLGITVPVACDVKNLLEGLTKLEKLELHVQEDFKSGKNKKDVKKIPGFRFPDQLKSLTLSNYNNLCCSSKLPSKLSELILVNMTVPKQLLPSLDLKALPFLELRNCKVGVGNSQVNFPKDVMVLHITQCEFRCPVLHLEGLKSLKNLRISGCNGLVEVAFVEALDALKELDIHSCDSLVRLGGDISKSKELKALSLKKNKKLNSVGGYNRLRPDVKRDVDYEWSSSDTTTSDRLGVQPPDRRQDDQRPTGVTTRAGHKRAGAARNCRARKKSRR